MRHPRHPDESLMAYVRASPPDRMAARQVAASKRLTGVAHIDRLAVSYLKFQLSLALGVFWLLWVGGMIFEPPQSWHTVLELTLCLLVFSTVLPIVWRKRLLRLRHILREER